MYTPYRTPHRRSGPHRETRRVARSSSPPPLHAYSTLPSPHTSPTVANVDAARVQLDSYRSNHTLWRAGLWVCVALVVAVVFVVYAPWLPGVMTLQGPASSTAPTAAPTPPHHHHQHHQHQHQHHHQHHQQPHSPHSPGWFSSDSWVALLSTVAGIATGLLALAASVSAFVRYITPPPPIPDLTPAQRKLLGLPPLPDHVPFTFPHHPHKLITVPAAELFDGVRWWWCSLCRVRYSLDAKAYTCSPCDFVVCDSCVAAPGTRPVGSLPPSRPHLLQGSPLGPQRALPAHPPPLGMRSPVTRGAPGIATLGTRIETAQDLDWFLAGRSSSMAGSGMVDGPVGPPIPAGDILPKYKTAVKSPPRRRRALGPPGSRPSSSKTGSLLSSSSLYSPFSPENRDAARMLLRELHIDSYMDSWTENARRWLSATVLQPVVTAINAYWSKRGLLASLPPETQSTAASSTTKKTGGFSFGGGGAKKKSGFSFGGSKKVGGSSKFGGGSSKFGGFGKSGATAAAQQQTPEQKMVAKLRKLIPKIEAYLNVLGSSSQDYVISRLQSLVSGSVLASYVWNGGGDWKGRPWSPELPTDAQILMHLFVTFMDFHMPSFSNGTLKAFTSRHFVPTSGASEAARSSDIKIVQTSVSPPHFCVAVRLRRPATDPSAATSYKPEPERVWEVSSGRNNLFETLILFAHYIRVWKNGYLHQVDMGHDYIGLLKVVEG